jgi:hypothetical protein
MSDCSYDSHELFGLSGHGLLEMEPPPLSRPYGVEWADLPAALLVNVLTFLCPIEAGNASISRGWRDVSTRYGIDHLSGINGVWIPLWEILSNPCSGDTGH